VFRIGWPDDYRVYACVKHGRGGKVRRLGSYTLGPGANEFDGIDIVKVAGRFAAYESATCDHTSCSGEVRVLDMRTGTVVHHSLIPQGDFEIYVLVLRASGSAAWSRTYSVTKVESGRLVVLEAGSLIDGYSLALHGSQLSWLSGGKTKTATLG
jgi:hypothetical protein